MQPESVITLLDGGMGRQLARMGAPFRLPEWSALALIEAPQFVSEAHAAYRFLAHRNSKLDRRGGRRGSRRPRERIADLDFVHATR
jgi:hypothetical protein